VRRVNRLATRQQPKENAVLSISTSISIVGPKHDDDDRHTRRGKQQREMRTLAASPDHVVGSVHALTEGGSLLIASASGSQLGPLVSGAGQVILVIGAQKIVPDVAAGLRRIYEYCYPLEDARARQAYGVPSGVNNILIINKAVTPGRVTAIIVNERLGF